MNQNGFLVLVTEKFVYIMGKRKTLTAEVYKLIHCKTNFHV